MIKINDIFLLAEIYLRVDVFLIIFARILGFILMLPVISGSNIPKLTKIAFALVCSILVFNTQAITISIDSYTVLSYGGIIIKEFIIGTCIAFIAYINFSLIYFTGQLIDFQLGLSMASVYDPVTQIQAPITGNLLYYIIAAFFVYSGGLHAFIGLIINSYKLLEVGDFNIIFSEKIIKFITLIISYSLEMGLKFSLPIMITLLATDVGLGILVKAVPQMNVFVVGMPIKVMIGFTVLFLITPMVINMYDFVFNNSYKNMLDLIEGLNIGG